MLQLRGFSSSYVNLQVKLLQVSTILREYSHKVCSANFIFYVKIHVKIVQFFLLLYVNFQVKFLNSFCMSQ